MVGENLRGRIFIFVFWAIVIVLGVSVFCFFVGPFFKQYPYNSLNSLTGAKEGKEFQKTNNLDQNKVIKQLVVVEELSNSAILFGLEWINREWIIAFDTIQVNIGKKGFVDPDRKIEGDLKTPTGQYPLGPAFGYEKDISPRIDFITIDSTHFWVSDPESEYYNRLVDFRPDGFEYEVMKRSDDLYKYGLVIQYNYDAPVPGKGSAIFIHVERKKGAPTAGCVSLSETKLVELIEWLDPDLSPVIIIDNHKMLEKQLNQE